MRAGARFPAISIAKVDNHPGKLIVIDGVGRLEAKKLNKSNSIDAEDLGQLTEVEAFAQAVRLNAQHGKPLSNIERLEAYRKLITQGYQVEKAAGLLSVRESEITKWKPATATKIGSGEKIPVQADRKLILWRVRELTSLLQAGINGDEQLSQALGKLAGQIKQLEQRDVEVRKQLRDLGILIETTVGVVEVQPVKPEISVKDTSRRP